jgi:hypothetical protein
MLLELLFGHRLLKKLFLQIEGKYSNVVGDALSKQTWKLPEKHEKTVVLETLQKILKDGNIRKYPSGFLHSPKPAAATKLHRCKDTRWKRIRASIIA